MNTLKRQINLMTLLGALTLVGCQQPGAISVNDVAVGAKSSQSRTPTSTSDVPVDQTLGGGSSGDGGTVTYLPYLDTTVSTEKCAEFLDASSINTNASNDINITGSSSDVKVVSVRNLMITGNSGDVSVNSAIYTKNVNGNSGRIFLNSVSISRIAGNSSKEICVNASSIGSVSGNSANVTIIADTIETISGGSGDNRITAHSIQTIQGNSSSLHIYKAQVTQMRGQSGLVCLHDGAQILDVDSSNNAIVRSDCP